MASLFKYRECNDHTLDIFKTGKAINGGLFNWL